MLLERLPSIYRHVTADTSRDSIIKLMVCIYFDGQMQRLDNRCGELADSQGSACMFSQLTTLKCWHFPEQTEPPPSLADERCVK